MCDRIGPSHWPVLEALHRAAMPDGPHWSGEAFAASLATPGAVALLARQGDHGAGDANAAGFALATSAGGEADLALIAVDPRYQRTGVGTLLLGCLGEALRAAGVEELFLDVAETNAPALAFYRAHGFIEVGRRAGYYRAQTVVQNAGHGGPKAGSAAKAVETSRADAIIMKTIWN